MGQDDLGDRMKVIPGLSPCTLLLVPTSEWTDRLLGPEPGGGRPSVVYIHLPRTRWCRAFEEPTSFLACVAPQIHHDERVARQLAAEDQSYPLPCPCGRKWRLSGGTMIWQHLEDVAVEALALRWSGQSCRLSRARLLEAVKSPDALLRQFAHVRGRRPALGEDEAMEIALGQIAEERGMGALVRIGDSVPSEGGP